MTSPSFLGNHPSQWIASLPAIHFPGDPNPELRKHKCGLSHGKQTPPEKQRRHPQTFVPPASRHSLALANRKCWVCGTVRSPLNTTEDRHVVSTLHMLIFETGNKTRERIAEANCVRPGVKRPGFSSCSVAWGLKPTRVFWALVSSSGLKSWVSSGCQIS